MDWGVVKFSQTKQINKKHFLGGIMMRRLITLFTILRVLIFTQTLVACPVCPPEPGCQPPTLDEVIIDGGGSPLIIDLEALVGVTECGQSWVKLPTTSASQIVEMTILLEEALYMNENQFGIYNYNGSGVAPSASEMLLVFDGNDGLGDSAEINFDLLAGTAWYDRNSNSIKDNDETVQIGSTFGFYLISPDIGCCISNPTFYSDELLNPDTTSSEHGLIYDVSEISSAIERNPDVVVAFEDLLVCHTDCDFDDIVVGVKGVSPVPEPATVILLGAGGLVLLRKRSS